MEDSENRTDDKKRESLSYFFRRLGVTGWLFLATSVLTIICTVVRNFVDKNSTLGLGIDIAIYILVASLAVEILYESYVNHDLSDQIRDITKKSESELNRLTASSFQLKELLEEMNLYKAIIFKDTSTVNGRIEKMLSDERVSKLQIICYGTGSFGGIIEKLIADKITLPTDILMYSYKENATLCDYDFSKDKATLQTLAETLMKHESVELYLCKIFPTLRACRFLDDKGNPLFCMVQPYLIDITEKACHLMSKKGLSPTIISGTENMKLLDYLSNFFEEYFNSFAGQSEVFHKRKQSLHLPGIKNNGKKNGK